MAALPPVVRGHAAAGVDPGLADAVGTLVAGLGRGVAVAAAVGVGDPEADTVGVGEVTEPGCGVHALTTTIPRARASAPYRIRRPNNWPKRE